MYRNRTGNPTSHYAFGGYFDVVLWGVLVNCPLLLHTCLHMLVVVLFSLVITVTRGAESMFIELKCQNLYCA
jgi:hypothetical protein